METDAPTRRDAPGLSRGSPHGETSPVTDLPIVRHGLSSTQRLGCTDAWVVVSAAEKLNCELRTVI